MSKQTVQRPRHLSEIQRIDEQARVSDLPAAPAAQKASKLLLVGPSLPRRLLLEGAEGTKITLGLDDLFHGSGAERADQLLLQVRDANVETESFHVGASEIGAEAGPLETAPEVALLCGVTEAREPDVKPPRAEQLEEGSDGLGAPDRHDGDGLGVKIPSAAFG